MSVAYIGPKSRTERPRKTKIDTEAAHVTRDSDTTFNVKRSTCRGGTYCGGLLLSLIFAVLYRWSHCLTDMVLNKLLTSVNRFNRLVNVSY